MFKGVNVCVYVGEGLRRSLATPDPFVLTNKICLNQNYVVCIRLIRGNIAVILYPSKCFLPVFDHFQRPNIV